LRDILKEPEQKLADYIKDPLGSDNKGILAQAQALGDEAGINSICNGRLRELTNQIENFKRLLEECERKNGKP
jgi:hypothetical protein